MDDVLFECIYTDSEELLREAFVKVRDKDKVDTGRALILFAVCVLAFAIWRKLVVSAVLSIILLCAGIYCLRIPGLKAHNTMANVRRINHGSVPSARIVIDDKITHYYKSNIAVMELEDLRAAFFLKKTIILVGEEGSTIFDRSGFTKGNAETFEAFLREKCPQTQIVHRA